MSFREPLAGPGPEGPADFGTPVSATVGVMVGIFAVGSTGFGETTGDGVVARIGIGAGDWLRTAGFKGGEVEPAGGAAATAPSAGEAIEGAAEGGGPFESCDEA